MWRGNAQRHGPDMRRGVFCEDRCYKEWLHANQYEPTRYKYEEQEDAVLVTVDFAGEMEAEAFATRFDGICGSYPQWTLLEILPPVA